MMLAERFRSFNRELFAAAVRRSNGRVDVNWAVPPINQ